MLQKRRYALLLTIIVLFSGLPAVGFMLRAYSTPSEQQNSNEIIFIAEKAYAASERNIGYETALAEIMEGSTEFLNYFPIVITGSQPAITVPVTLKRTSTWGYSFQEAYDGGNFWGQSTTGIAASIRPFESLTYYFLSRTFIVWNVPESPDGYTISSIKLVMEACGSAHGGMPFGVTKLHLGTWPGYLADDDVMWNAFDPSHAVAEFTEDRTCPPPYQQTNDLEISLDPNYFTPGQTVKFVVRDGEDHVNWRPLYPEHIARRGMFSSVLAPLYWHVTYETNEQ
jgi:hypothetical protein